MKVREAYLKAGWPVAIPVSHGKKYPPAEGTTGNVPAPTLAKLTEIWDEYAPTQPNLALRLHSGGEDFDVITVDVDHYGVKTGVDTIKELEKQLGAFPWSAPMSTRRGPELGTGQYFFRVRKGMSWKGAIGPGVDVIQDTHRYAVVYPSIVEGLQYQWYVDGELSDIPSIDNLPWLPDAWQDYASAGAAKEHHDKSKSKVAAASRGKARMRAAISWLRENTLRYGHKDALPTEAMQKTYGPEFVEALGGNAHDTMLAAVHQSVRLALEAHTGLKVALSRIRRAFVEEVTGSRAGASRRSEESALAEFERALIGEVEKAEVEAANGTRFLSQDVDEEVLSSLDRVFSRQAAVKRPKGVDLSLYRDTDRAHAEMFASYWGQDVLVTRDKNTKEFAVWDEETKRYFFRTQNEMFQLLYTATSDRIRYEADKIAQRASELKVALGSHQAPPDTDDPDELFSEANNLRKRADSIESTSRSLNILKQVHSVYDKPTSVQDFDSVPGLVGLLGGETLDVSSLESSGYPRPSKRKDRLTMNTQVRLAPGVKHPGWTKFLDKFLPDPELRRFTQKVLGYSLVDGNPEKIVVFLWGPSNTGKTTILEACGAALGDYGGTIDANALFGKSNRSGPAPELIDSFFRRFVFMSEVGDTHVLSANAIKQATGNDTQKNRLLFSNEMISGSPKFTPYISTNTVPEVKGSDKALARRLVVIPFLSENEPSKVKWEEDVRNNPEIQLAVLAWLLEGCQMYLKEGLDRNNFLVEVRNASAEFASDVDPVSEFISEVLTTGVEGEIREDQLWLLWREWGLVRGLKESDIGDRRRLRKRLKGHGINNRRTMDKDRKYYRLFVSVSIK